MPDNSNDSILIAGGTALDEKPARQERGLGRSKKEVEVKPVQVSELRKNVNTFFSQLSEILDMDKCKVGAFQVNQVEISAQITGEGKVCLLGSGTKLGVSGGFKFILERADLE